MQIAATRKEFDFIFSGPGEYSIYCYIITVRKFFERLKKYARGCSVNQNDRLKGRRKILGKIDNVAVRMLLQQNNNVI